MAGMYACMYIFVHRYQATHLFAGEISVNTPNEFIVWDSYDSNTTSTIIMGALNQNYLGLSGDRLVARDTHKGIQYQQHAHICTGTHYATTLPHIHHHYYLYTTTYQHYICVPRINRVGINWGFAHVAVRKVHTRFTQVITGSDKARNQFIQNGYGSV